MRATTYRQYGPPSVLQVEQLPSPSPQPNEIKVRVLAAEVTKADTELRSFHFPVSWFKWPLRLALGLSRPRNPVLGNYFAGEVVEIGDAVTRFHVGDTIFGSTRMKMGCYSEMVCVPEAYTLTHKPSNIHFAEAATLPLGGLNALHFLNQVNIEQGTKVLINGAGGSIGLYALQLAKARGAHVTAVDAQHKEETLIRMGADEFIDYTLTPLGSPHFANGSRFDVLLSTVVGMDFCDCENLLKPNGTYLMANPRISDMVNGLGLGVRTSKRAVFQFAAERQHEIDTLRALVENGTIKPILDRVYTFEHAAEAHRRVETEQRTGAIVLTSAEEHQE